MSIATKSSSPEHLHTPSSTPVAVWHKSAPTPLRREYAQGRAAKGWLLWRKHLRARKTPAPLAKLFPHAEAALAWGLADAELAATLAGIAACAFLQLEDVDTAADDAAEQAVQNWLDETEVMSGSYEFALSALAWCWALPKLAGLVSANTWWSLLNRLLDTAAEAAAAVASKCLAEGDPRECQILAGELPLALAYLFPEIAACRALHAAARATLSVGLLDLLDGDGLLHARQFPRMRGLLACWTRCLALGRRMKRPCWSHEAQRLYRRLVGNAVRLVRRDGSQVLSGRAATPDLDLLCSALEWGGHRADWAAAATFCGKHAPAVNDMPPGKKAPGRRTARQTIHSEWAATAVLRPHADPASPHLTVLFPDANCRTELVCGRDVVWSGTWDFEVLCDGVPARPTSDWEENCWITDADVDYLELEIALDNGLRMQRHVILAREDRLLLLADALLGTRHARLQYRGSLPLQEGVCFRQTCETREGALQGRKRRATVLPLALPEWHAEREDGEVRQTATGLELRQSAEGCSLFAPLLFDLDRERQGKPLTWRRLTVAAQRVKQPADVAVGFRASIGKRNWLIYRSLAAPANRTVLGHNLSTEFLFAQFGRDGEVAPLIEIE